MEYNSIYTISHPITLEILYVGRTDYLKSRIQQHRSGNKSTKIGIFINSIKKDGLYPIIEEVYRCKCNEAPYWEQFYIELFKQWGFNLLNSVVACKRKTRHNDTLIRMLHNVCLSLEDLCNIYDLDYLKYNYAITFNSLDYKQSEIIFKYIEHVKNHPTVRQRKADQSAKRKAIKKTSNSKTASIR